MIRRLGVQTPLGAIFDEIYFCCVTSDLSDNLTEMRIVKNSIVPKDGRLTNAFIRATCQASSCTVGQDHVPRGTKLEASEHQNLSFFGKAPHLQNHSAWY